MNKPPPPPSAEVLAIRSYNARLGIVLFVFYLAAYIGFVGLSASESGRGILRQASLGGVNVAVLYGFGLIFGAFIVSIVYMLLCKNLTSSAS
ncbi:DUF485 domain-containing protein [Anatilimnocola floriformis]|uniref:DUF485 domain-containing protein n=1 Tax=Anatilimnocola floriformis TaxID=2948575 RepID=UPI0020C2689C|nr:DUF485 domain-containing protein [Anatilimnocola floriformis]